MKKLILGVVMITMMLVPFMVGTKVFASGCNGENQVETSIIHINGSNCYDAENDKEGGAIFDILNIILNTLTAIIGVAGTLGIIISGIQYMTARDNDQQVAKAKMRLIQIVIGLAAYAVMFAFLSWLIPGGLI